MQKCLLGLKCVRKQCAVNMFALNWKMYEYLNWRNYLKKLKRFFALIIVQEKLEYYAGHICGQGVCQLLCH